jgi:hypothetical protein
LHLSDHVLDLNIVIHHYSFVEIVQTLLEGLEVRTLLGWELESRPLHDNGWRDISCLGHSGIDKLRWFLMGRGFLIVILLGSFIMIGYLVLVSLCLPLLLSDAQFLK